MVGVKWLMIYIYSMLVIKQSFIVYNKNILEKLQWSVPIIEGKTQPRMGHSAQLYDGKIVIFGGWNGFKVLDDVVFIDLKNGI